MTTNAAGPLLTIANQLTLLRMGLSPFLVVLVLGHELRWALVVFVVAGITDLLDGLVARMSDQRTMLGAMLDPVADKLLLGSALLALTWGSDLPVRIPAWLTVIVLSRDVIIVVSVAVVNLTVGRRVFYPSILGKACTLMQVVTVGVVLLCNALGGAPPWVAHFFRATFAITVASAVHYVYRASRGFGAGAAAAETP